MKHRTHNRNQIANNYSPKTLFHVPCFVLCEKIIKNKTFSVCLLAIITLLTLTTNSAQAFDSADCDSGDLSTTCTITSTKTLADGETITGNNLVIDSGGNLTTAFNSTTHAYNSFIINLSGDLTLQNGGTITGNTDITATNLTIDGTSSIDVSGKGYSGGESSNSNGYGPGGGQQRMHWWWSRLWRQGR